MARPLRMEYLGAVYQVMNRGNARSAIVLDDKDRELFLYKGARNLYYAGE